MKDHRMSSFYILDFRNLTTKINDQLAICQTPITMLQELMKASGSHQKSSNSSKPQPGSKPTQQKKHKGKKPGKKGPTQSKLSYEASLLNKDGNLKSLKVQKDFAPTEFFKLKAKDNPKGSPSNFKLVKAWVWLLKCSFGRFWWILVDFEEEGVAMGRNEEEKLGGGAYQGQSVWRKTTGAKDL
ncbi:hypothetical protein PPACK8108_LOCUS14898 [Phakopsora pachyrhizi]|uniref:Uncharacterized protein n=1 Tax=Phakopsora pachyrhizi TaxID=170000 RepID=A0AAV0BAN1_PHAPC|nr:hypothetical protein PPACK8108_LOCUS14898 [Phakopsora pachyrhizi]